MYYFFIDREVRPGTEQHLVHSSVCEHLPPAENLIPLGMHAHCEAALWKARELYPTAVRCAICCIPFRHSVSL